MTSPPDPTLDDLRADLAAVTAERDRLAADLAHVQALTEQGAALVAAMAEGVTRCARCGETPVLGTREEMPVCPGCERVVALEVERDRLARDNAALREAAGALVKSLDRPDDGWRAWLCSVCGGLATERDSEEAACDRHLDILDRGEKVPTDHAAPLRALRALLAQGED